VYTWNGRYSTGGPTASSHTSSQVKVSRLKASSKSLVLSFVHHGPPHVYLEGSAGNPRFSHGDGTCDRAILESLLSGLTPVGGCNTMEMRAADRLPCHGERQNTIVCSGVRRLAPEVARYTAVCGRYFVT